MPSANPPAPFVDDPGAASKAFFRLVDLDAAIAALDFDLDEIAAKHAASLKLTLAPMEDAS